MGLAASSADSFVSQSSAEEKHLLALTILSLCNHSPLKISLCRLPGQLQFNTWILIPPLHLPPSPCQSSQRWAAQALGEGVSLCRSGDVVGIGRATLGPPLGWRNRSTSLQDNSHGGRRDKEPSKNSRKC